jgi:hypothetical protein
MVGAGSRGIPRNGQQWQGRSPTACLSPRVASCPWDGQLTDSEDIVLVLLVKNTIGLQRISRGTGVANVYVADMAIYLHPHGPQRMTPEQYFNACDSDVTGSYSLPICHLPCGYLPFCVCTDPPSSSGILLSALHSSLQGPSVPV